MNVGGERMRYIGAQGPLAVTAPDFWQMVWESEANLIVMVTSEVVSMSVRYKFTCFLTCFELVFN